MGNKEDIFSIEILWKCSSAKKEVYFLDIFLIERYGSGSLPFSLSLFFLTLHW